ncbi:MAG: SMC-Scp complex subunit ScpB [Planctomycetes bacterium]|nr:SMC-Scp complex subunit ScpB [Planctomycetota bacterium]
MYPQEEGKTGKTTPPVKDAAADDPAEIRPVVEALLFATNQPLTIKRLTEITGREKREILQAIDNLQNEYDGTNRAFQIEEIAGGFLVLSRKEYHRWVIRLEKKVQESKLSPAAMETLSIVAYKQPILRATIEAIRGVESSQMLRSLMDKGLVKVVGKDETLGRPLLYGTTKRFLDQFGLASLHNLPRTQELSS